MKLRNTAKKVEWMLKNRAMTRDNDQLLISFIWSREMKKLGYDPEEVSATAFFSLYSSASLLSSAESIRRSRQKLQEEHPELRGERYRARHEKEEPETREELRNM